MIKYQVNITKPYVIAESLNKRLTGRLKAYAI